MKIFNVALTMTVLVLATPAQADCSFDIGGCSHTAGGGHIVDPHHLTPPRQAEPGRRLPYDGYGDYKDSGDKHDFARDIGKAYGGGLGKPYGQ